MEKIKLLLVMLSFSILGYSQNPEEWQSLEFKNAEDYKANEGKIMECATFVLDSPAEMNNPARLSAMGAISRWMSGTPDYTFAIDESIMDLTKKNDVILSIYMAAMTKFVLENKDQADDMAAVKLNAFNILLNYCEDSLHKVNITKDLQKAIKAKNNGKLKEYLKL